MTHFQATPEQTLYLMGVATAMQQDGLQAPFITQCVDLARHDPGAYELMELWLESEAGERDEIVADLQDLIDEARELSGLPDAEQKPYIRFDDLDEVARQVAEYKRKLRAIIDRHGGVTAVARKVGMPQPSLSRLLSSASMPRRTTLYRIANGLGIPETDIVTEWVQ